MGAMPLRFAARVGPNLHGMTESAAGCYGSATQVERALPRSERRAVLEPLARVPRARFADISFVLSDLDDTISHDGALPASAYAAMEQFTASGRKLVIVTGRPAGWCDLIARFWPVAGVVGENGAFLFPLYA
jgi:hypothetical protein